MRCVCVRVSFGKGPKTRFWCSPEEEEEKEEKEDAEREREVVCVQKALFFCVFLSSWGRHGETPECLGFY